MTTKERITYEALCLFSRKGYKGTSVKNIADAVGIKDSSLYKHFASKQEILDSIMVTIKQRIEQMAVEFGIPGGEDIKRVVPFYAGLNGESLVKFSRKIFLFYLKDDILSKFWRMGMIEQFQNEQVYALFRTFFIEDSIEYQKALFGEMSNQGIFITADPQVMAISFYTPMFFLLTKYSGVEGKEDEALEILEKQVREFYRIYIK